jgi:hypothetical protein
MELREVVRTTPSARLIGIPVLVGIVVALLLGLSQERDNEAVGTVSLSAFLDVDATAFGSGGQVDDFIVSVESPIVGNAVAQSLGPDAGGATTLTAEREGSGTLVTVTYRAASPEQAVAGLEAGVRQALRSVATARLTGARDRLAVADDQLAQAGARLAELEAAAGGPDVANTYRDRSTEVSSLRAQLVQAEAGGGDTAALQALLDEREAQRQQIAAVLNEWERTKEAAASAAQARDVADREVLAGEQLLGRIDTEAPVTVTSVSPESVLSTVLLPAVAAAVAAFGVVLAWTMLRGHDGSAGPSRGPERARFDDGSAPAGRDRLPDERHGRGARGTNAGDIDDDMHDDINGDINGDTDDDAMSDAELASFLDGGRVPESGRPGT